MPARSSTSGAAVSAAWNVVLYHAGALPLPPAAPALPPPPSGLNALLAGGSAHGTLTLNANGSFSYTPSANFNGIDPAGNAPKGKYLGRTTRVGAYPPNKLGLSDMHGNVSQWCAGSVDPGGGFRMGRGGDWLGRRRFCDNARCQRWQNALLLSKLEWMSR